MMQIELLSPKFEVVDIIQKSKAAALKNIAVGDVVQFKRGLSYDDVFVLITKPNDKDVDVEEGWITPWHLKQGLRGYDLRLFL